MHNVFCESIRPIWGVPGSFCRLIIFMTLDCRVPKTIMSLTLLIHSQRYVPLLKLYMDVERSENLGTSNTNKRSFE